jgi:CheY-like chemotaxis protein
METDRSRVDGMLIKPFVASGMLGAVADAANGSGAASKPREARAAVPRRLQGLRVLVVEDNVTNQIVARELLRDEGAAVELAGGGLAAIRLLEEAPGRCDAVLMDVQMPDLDGYEATRRIREQLGLRDLPIVAMTANTMESDRAAALQAGMNEHIGKPIDLDRVVATLLAQAGRPPADSGDSALPPDGLPPDPAGFALEPALKRMGYNKSLYARQARRFPAEYGSGDTEIRRLLEEGKRSDAAAQLHTLRGVAAALGADALAGHAAGLEDAVKADAPAPELEKAVQRLGELLAAAGAALRQLADGLDDDRAAAAAPAPPDAAAITQRIATLASLLEEGNMRAVDLFSELRASLSGLPEDRLARLDGSFERLDFVGALDVVRELGVEGDGRKTGGMP